MIKRIFQSPLFNILLIIGLGLIMLSKYYQNDIPTWLKLDPLVLGIPIFILLAIIPIHNKKYPKDKIKPTLIPMEFKEEDEGLQWITFKATRKVYIFFATFIPIAIALTASFHEFTYLPIILFIIMGVAQYSIFWFETKKHQ